jgi:catechol 2,3-dioxygenase-like lactoylglutathione lyase family enzyme
MTAPLAFTGLHHARIPVSDLDRAVTFWRERFGFEWDFDFPGDLGDGAGGGAGERAGVAVRSGAVSVVLWLDPQRAAATRGFVSVGIGVPDTSALESLARALDLAGVAHGGIHPAFVESKLTFVEDPDGNLINFYVMPVAA